MRISSQQNRPTAIHFEELPSESDVILRLYDRQRGHGRGTRTVRLQVREGMHYDPVTSLVQPPRVRISRYLSGRHGQGEWTMVGGDQRIYTLLGSLAYRLDENQTDHLPTVRVPWVLIPEASPILEPHNDPDLIAAIGGSLIEAMELRLPDDEAA